MATIYTSGEKYAAAGPSTASQVILSSVLHIGGGAQSNAEDAVHALNSGGGGSLAELSNVEISNPQDGDILYYEDLRSIWINKHQLKIVTWAEGSNVEIAAMLDAHYAGEIDITDYWNVGDERTVSLSAMTATGVGESHVAQDVTMVLMNEGGKTLVTPVNGHNECAFIVGQKNLLANNGTPEGGYMNSSGNTGGWNGCMRRTWCNSIYKNALPSTLVGIFKEHQNITAIDLYGSIATSNDYFALPSEKEVFGSTTYANSTAETNNKQFEYYINSSCRNKSNDNWWERSMSGDYQFCFVNVGSASSHYANNIYGLAPFGVI